MPTSILLLTEANVIAAICTATLLILPPGEKPNKLDLATVKRAKVRCAELYPQSPCARKVVRKGKLSYRVYCSGESK
jgi:hypothetical protein